MVTLRNLGEPWETLGNLGEPWGTLGNLGEPWGNLGNPWEPWGTLGNLWEPLGHCYYVTEEVKGKKEQKIKKQSKCSFFTKWEEMSRVGSRDRHA